MPLANRISLSKWYPSASWLYALFSFSVLLSACFSLFMYPLLFKLGYQKGKLWGMYLPLGVFGLACIALMEYQLISGNETFITDLLIYASGHRLLVSGGMLGTAALVFAASWALSMHVYSKREF